MRRHSAPARTVVGVLAVGHRCRRACPALLVAACLSACVGAPTTTSERAVRRLWDEYLASKKGQFAANAGTSSPLWSASEQAQWPMYDLAGFYLPDWAVPEVLSVTPINAAVDSAYRIVTRFWPASRTARDASTKPVLTMTVYARREGRRWKLANANVMVYDGSISPDIRNAVGAVLTQMLHESGGADAVREYMQSPQSALRETLERQLQRPWPAIVEEWRRRVEGIEGA